MFSFLSNRINCSVFSLRQNSLNLILFNLIKFSSFVFVIRRKWSKMKNKIAHNCKISNHVATTTTTTTTILDLFCYFLSNRRNIPYTHTHTHIQRHRNVIVFHFIYNSFILCFIVFSSLPLFHFQLIFISFL